MLLASIDDSGGEDQFGVFYGGIVAPEGSWNEFEPRWKRILHRYGLGEYHGSKMGNLTRGWRTKRRNDLDRDLAKEIRRMNPVLLGSTVSFDHFNPVARKYRLSADPSMVCLEATIQSARKASQEISPGEQFRLLIDTARRGSSARIIRLIEEYKRCSEYLDSLYAWTFGNRRDRPALQAADFVSHEIFRWERGIKRDAEARPKAEIHRLLLSGREPRIFHSDPDTFEQIGQEITAGTSRFLSIAVAGASDSPFPG